MKDLFEEYKPVFSLIKESLFPSGEEIEITDWDAVFREMKAQSVAVLPFNWLKDHHCDQSEAWERYCSMMTGRWLYLMHAQDSLLRLLEENSIPCVIIKGSSSAVNYPVPSFRTAGDVDFLVKRCDFERAAALLENSGYKPEEENRESFHHFGYHKDNVSFELHRRLGIIREEDEELIALFEKGIDRRVIKVAEGFSFPSLPDDLNGLVLVFHIDQHLRSGLGMRQIVDWMMYINSLPSDDWKNDVIPVLRKTGTEKLALTVTVMCQRYLGLREIVEDTGIYPCEEL
ncbi:MAG: nucleotidyltransferase family protein, partial [Clostridia bacterium]|nr:nucleotidyltransferase family protein [Clostridia bacterium]